jgi:hypothetical protein
MVLTACPSAISAEDTGTNFFLKASKSVPRIGRRSEYDNFFPKASKSVPRIGRRRDMPPVVSNSERGVTMTAVVMGRTSWEHRFKCNSFQ